MNRNIDRINNLECSDEKTDIAGKHDPLGIDNTEGSDCDWDDDDYGINEDVEPTTDEVGSDDIEPDLEAEVLDDQITDGEEVESDTDTDKVHKPDLDVEVEVDFDKEEGVVKERLVSNIFNEAPVNEEYVEKGISIINRDADGVLQIEKGSVIDKQLLDVGSDNSEMIVRDGDKSELVVRGDQSEFLVKSRRGIEDIVGKFYEGKVQLDDDINLYDRLANIRKWYSVIDGEIRGLNRLGFVNYKGFIKECPNLMNILKSFIN